MLSGCHLDHYAAETPNICIAVTPELPNDLRSHPVAGARHGIDLSAQGLLTDLFAGPEVGQLAHPFFADEDVVAFQVPVHYLVVMQVLQSFQDLLQEAPY